MRFRITTMTVNPASVGCISYGPDSEVAAMITPLDRIRAGLSHLPAVSLAANATPVRSRRRGENVNEARG